MGGDFNVVRSISEKLNSTTNTISMRCFAALIDELELIDPPLLNAKFTWSNFRDEPICCKLDRFLFLRGWLELFPHVRQTALPRITSDHFSILLVTTNSTWGPSPFIFENAWLDHGSFMGALDSWWGRAIGPG